MRAFLLLICVVYGYLIATLFGGDHFNQVYLWSSFILFVINNATLNGALNHIIEDDEHNDEE